MAKARSENDRFLLESFATPTRYNNPRKSPGTPLTRIQPFDARPVPFWRADRGVTSLLFHHALQGMLVLACKIHHLRHLGLGDLVGEHAALPDSVMMDVEHDLGRGFDVLLEEFFQDMNDEFHRRVVVVQD